MHPEVEAELTRRAGTRARRPPAHGGRRPALPYTEWVVREAMRLYPPAWGIGREALEDCEIGGYHVPRGTQIFLIQYLVHRDPRWFDEPRVVPARAVGGDLVEAASPLRLFPLRRRARGSASATTSP